MALHMVDNDTLHAASQGCTEVVDALAAKYYINRKKLLGSGADGGVVRGVDRVTGEWHALKYISSSAHSGELEIEILRGLRHPNIINMLAVYAPERSRRHTVIAVKEADFTLTEYLQRSIGRSRLTATVQKDLASQLLCGMLCVREHNVVHRDIKPCNILLSHIAPDESSTTAGASCLRLMLADFSRARSLPKRRRTRVKAARSALYFGREMSANVTTPNYCAPEIIFFTVRGADESETTEMYGTEVDVWGFGAVFFEMLTLERLVLDGSTAESCAASLICRLGHAEQASFSGHRSKQQLADTAGRLGLKSVGGFCPWAFDSAATVLGGALQWQSWKRMTIPTLQLQLAIGDPLAASQPTGSNTKVGESHERQQDTKRAKVTDASAPAASQGVRPSSRIDLTPTPVRKSETWKASIKCACAGHCYTPGHRYRNGCECSDLVVDSDYCLDCVCEVVGCAKPRLRGTFCSYHGKVWNACEWEMRAIARSHTTAYNIMPCDITDFIDKFWEHRYDLGSLIVFAMLKEPSSTTAWVRTGVPGMLHTVSVDTFAESLSALAKNMHESPPVTEMKQLNKQGVARFLGTATTLSRLGVIELVRKSCKAEGTPSRDGEVVLGLTLTTYRFTGHTQKAQQFLTACKKQESAWKQALEETDLAQLVHALHAIVSVVSTESGGVIQASEKNRYIHLSVLRKLLIGCLCFGAVQADWTSVYVPMLKDMGPDENMYLDAFPSTWSIAEVSRFLFARDDMGIFASMYACLWHDVGSAWPDRRDEVLELVSTGRVGQRASALAKSANHACCPHHIVEDMLNGT
jgi:serine/threonine protein kinase